MTRREQATRREPATRRTRVPFDHWTLAMAHFLGDVARATSPVEPATHGRTTLEQLDRALRRFEQVLDQQVRDPHADVPLLSLEAREEKYALRTLALRNQRRFVRPFTLKDDVQADALSVALSDAMAHSPIDYRGRRRIPA